jgi:hypothetical protein
MLPGRIPGKAWLVGASVRGASLAIMSDHANSSAKRPSLVFVVVAVMRTSYVEPSFWAFASGSPRS